MTIKNLYSEAEQAEIQADIARLRREYQIGNIPKRSQRYFTQLAEKYRLIEKLETEIEKYPLH